ncbi:MAG: glutamate--tRNA ligase [Deltaproteobacteria bacterium]|nr:glutamate--tRNA ligase [Deltaproteobacteria bacterium]MBW1952380.1 glutamate--tRNA ligase [Deltaproteobacteria bacterium]MBW1985891.1 glutamate--tRNA ligase [Deltaproteobacteria bacterium]MBW2133651.1 glutamate--tRNA ligase [Deltaproteobacteria bacterium]
MALIRTRFSPSPTGYFHLGGARTALFNWLFARHHQGVFVLRIEDTDVARSEARYEEDILESLLWLGLDWDEGPYYQSSRLELYHDFVKRLLAAGAAYYCDCPPERLEEKRRAALARGENPRYDGHCRNRNLGPSANTAVRFRSPQTGSTHWHDLTKGPIAFDNQELDDLVLLRADGIPTYNFAVVVDDLTMEITHVIRGDDHIPNTPRQILLYQALGAACPQFAHIPMILGPDKAKLSKRHGALSVLAYRDMGFLPQALVNYLARLGWSHGDQEIFSREELINYFSLDQVSKSAGIFNADKLLWLNGHYIRETADDKLARSLRNFLAQQGILTNDVNYLTRVVATLKPRAHTLVEMAEMARFYFRDPRPYEEKAAQKFLTPTIRPVLAEIRTRLATLPELREEDLNRIFTEVQKRSGLKMVALAQAVRVALTGKTASPGLFEIMDILGKEEVLQRLAVALESIRD